MNPKNGLIPIALVAQVLMGAPPAHADPPGGSPTSGSLRSEEGFAPLPSQAPRVAVQVRGHFLEPRDPAFRDIYGGGPAFGIEVSARVTDRIDIWADGSRLGREGLLTFSREKTTMSVLPLTAGVRYRVRDARVVPYGAAGVGLFLFKESNPLGDAGQSGLGFTARTGALVWMHQRLTLDLRFGYSYCSMKPAALDINVGGLELGVGLAFGF